MTYRTYAAAEARVFRLVLTVGAWPGIVRCRGGWRLTYDPSMPLAELDAHGYYSG